MAYNAVTQPPAGSQVLVHVTAIRSPHVFYAVALPFDNIDVSIGEEEAEAEAEIERKLRVLEEQGRKGAWTDSVDKTIHILQR